MAEKDEIFRNHIAHLMEQVSDLCEEHGVSMVALFETAAPELYGYLTLTDDSEQIPAVVALFDEIGTTSPCH